MGKAWWIGGGVLGLALVAVLVARSRAQGASASATAPPDPGYDPGTPAAASAPRALRSAPPPAPPYPAPPGQAPQGPTPTITQATDAAGQATARAAAPAIPSDTDYSKGILRGWIRVQKKSKGGRHYSEVYPAPGYNPLGGVPGGSAAQQDASRFPSPAEWAAFDTIAATVSLQ